MRIAYKLTPEKILLMKEESERVEAALAMLSETQRRRLFMKAEGGTNWPVLMAACLMMILPIVVAYIFFNKKIQSAFVYKGIK